MEPNPALVLNADYRPLCYFPLSLWGWQEVVKAVFMGRVNVVSHYDTYIHSPSQSLRLPSVVSLKSYVKQSETPAFTRFNLFLRDEFKCQYCGTSQDLTFDHVIPRSHGGKTCWENVVAACSPCNLKKANHRASEVNMHLHYKPFKPSSYQLQERGRRFPPDYLHESWLDFLYWDSELEP